MWSLKIFNFIFITRRFVFTIDFNNVGIRSFPFLIKLRTFTFSLEGRPSRLLCSVSELPASLLRHAGAMTKQNQGDLNTSPAIAQQWI